MSIFSRLRGRIGFLELILLILIGLLGSGLWYFWTLPSFVLEKVEIEQHGNQLFVSLTPRYRGGCETVRLAQWAERVETGQIRWLSDYEGPPRAQLGESDVQNIISLGRSLEPGYWVWHAEAVCTLSNGGQEQFRAPPTRFFVEGPT